MNFVVLQIIQNKLNEKNTECRSLVLQSWEVGAEELVVHLLLCLPWQSFFASFSAVSSDLPQREIKQGESNKSE